MLLVTHPHLFLLLPSATVPPSTPASIRSSQTALMALHTPPTAYTTHPQLEWLVARPVHAATHATILCLGFSRHVHYLFRVDSSAPWGIGHVASGVAGVLRVLDVSGRVLHAACSREQLHAWLSFCSFIVRAVGLPHVCVHPSECYRAGTTQDHPEIRSGENVHQREFTDLALCIAKCSNITQSPPNSSPKNNFRMLNSDSFHDTYHTYEDTHITTLNIAT
ncbi:hypothetical protein C8J57DRAFT_1505132 [Mycena rebaudengoi]|nr:hypothetical protein C8J57DRAFT_1505132 [Mycena rebaudengoi]